MTDKNYEVGYKKPPKANQFKSGQSGNPKGRPKGTKNLATDLQEELSATIFVREGGKDQKISKQRGLVKKLILKALNGDIRAIVELVKMTERLLGDEVEAQNASEKPLAQSDQEILDAFLKANTETENMEGNSNEQ